MVNIPGPAGFGPLPPPGAPAGKPAAAGGKSFKDLFQEQLEQVNRMQVEADQAYEQMMLKPDPSPEDVDQVMVAARKAQLAFDSLMQVRNKLVDAFEELMRMRI